MKKQVVSNLNLANNEATSCFRAGNLHGKCFYKVAWKDCCYPKDEGGLGLKNIHLWNEAATIFQLWRIINKVDSLWINWLYAYELHRQSFWTMNIPAKSSWAWRKILSCRRKALTFIRYIPGLASNFLLWHDPWLNHKPLALQFDNSVMSALGSHSFALLNTIQQEDNWSLGISNYLPVRDLRTQCENIIIRGMDRIIWDSGGAGLISTSSIYSSLLDHRVGPPWLPFVWCKFRIPKFAFTAWLILKERLLTKDRMQAFTMNVNLQCLLCGVSNEDHEHLFSTCSFSRNIFNDCPLAVSAAWNDMLSGRFFTTVMDSTRTNIGYLFLAAAFYYIWQEKNFRMHNLGKFNSAIHIVRKIQEDVRGYLCNCVSFRKAVKNDITLLSFIY